MLQQLGAEVGVMTTDISKKRNMNQGRHLLSSPFQAVKSAHAGCSRFFEDKKNRDCNCGILWSLNVLTHLSLKCMLSTARKPWTIPEKYLTKTIQPCTGRMQSLLETKGRC